MRTIDPETQGALRKEWAADARGAAQGLVPRIFKGIIKVLRIAVQKRPSEENLPAREPPAKKQRKAKPYVPTLRSGPYALLIALAKESGNSSHGMTKSALIEAAQPYCDSSFTVPSDPSKFYTAWNSMKTLIQKDLVYEQGRPLKRYFLTDEGWEVAKRIMETATDVQSVWAVH